MTEYYDPEKEVYRRRILYASSDWPPSLCKMLDPMAQDANTAIESIEDGAHDHAITILGTIRDSLWQQSAKIKMQAKQPDD